MHCIAADKAVQQKIWLKSIGKGRKWRKMLPEDKLQLEALFLCAISLLLMQNWGMREKQKGKTATNVFQDL